MLNTPGLNKSLQKKIMKRLELSNKKIFFKLNINLLSDTYKKEIVGFLNRFYSQISSVNHLIYELKKLNVIRLYLIKNYKGRCHAIGKPVKAQRTWSNAWSSYNNNKLLRKFIVETKNKMSKNLVKIKIDYKKIKKMYLKKAKVNNIKTKKKLLWL